MARPHGSRRRGRPVAQGGPKRRASQPARKDEGARRPPRPKGLVWTGTISFGLVNIPVALHSGESASELHFSMLDKRDLAPIGYKKINKSTGEEVSAKEIVKAYKYGDERYVTLSEEDFRRASPERTRRIDMLRFVDARDIDPAFFQRPYVLEPAAKSDKAYALLREALRRSGKVGVATLVLRAKQYLAALRADGRALRLDLLRYGSELRDPADLRLPGEELSRLKISEAELKMAESLIDGLSGEWDPAAFRDEYRDELLAFIEKKARAGGLEAAPAPPARAEESAPEDIMALLKRSLSQAGKGGAYVH